MVNLEKFEKKTVAVMLASPFSLMSPPLVIYLVLNKHIKSLTKQRVRTWRLKVDEPRLQVKIEPKDK